jgi:hypothetical protein
MIDSLKPGQTIRCTVLKLPRAAADRKTIERLMRRDPAVTRGLRRSHKLRARTTVTYNRGNRDWVQRQKVGKIVRLVKGNSWTCTFDLGVAPDFKAVSDFLKVEAA